MARARSIVAAVLVGLAAATAASARAEPYPARPVRIIVPFAPGGGNDIIARFIAKRLGDSLGKPFLVDNKPGAGGTLGVEAGIKSPPDGHTLVMVSPSYAVNPSVYKLNFDPVVDITPIIQVAQGPQLIVVHPAVPAGSIEELITLARRNPGAVSFASAGPGSITHVGAELFCSAAKVKMLHVPYKGTAPALNDTIGGQTQVLFSATSALLPHVRSGRLRALAVTSKERVAALPDVPTVAESGLPDFEVVLWHGVIGPRGIPASVVARLNAEIARALQLPEAAEQLASDGVVPAGGTPDAFLERIRKDIAVWRKVVADAGLKLE
jgi:tripartite-type tricarboxylate transporter receptor subunit TctC